MTTTYDDAVALRHAGRYADAEALLRPWLQLNRGDAPGRNLLGNLLLMQGKATVPAGVEAQFVLARRLAAERGPAVLQGADEGVRLDQAAAILLPILDELPPVMRPAAANILVRTGYYAEAARLGDFAEIGRYCALNGVLSVNQLARVDTDADRAELMHQHRAWGEVAEAKAAARPLPPRPPRAPRSRRRIGFLSADLRHHVVAFFTQPLFEFLDPRFDLYVYSTFSGAPDVVQPWFAARSAAYRDMPNDDHEAAAMIAADDLDILIDLGGPTPNNRPDLMAYGAAPLQASWLGYPHSLGLKAIDYLIVDPVTAPADPALIMERPLMLPRTFISMAPAAFAELPDVGPSPVGTAGMVTFGTANDPYKFSPRVLRTWARIVAQIPTSRFMIVRPEGGSARFRQNIEAIFAAEGVGAERLFFYIVRGGVKAAYARMDVALDTFPVTGGTTTCEALWAGVPTITLRGEGLHERLSASIMTNAGLSELVADTVEDYTRIAVDLAGDLARLAELRRTLRDRVRANPLGQPQRFAADFYDLMDRATGA